jgi:hypothetical protein
LRTVRRPQRIIKSGLWVYFNFLLWDIVRRKACSVILVVALLGINVYVYAENEGLTGVLYEGSDYTDARQTFYLGSLDEIWSEDDQLGKGWTAKWRGFGLY